MRGFLEIAWQLPNLRDELDHFRRADRAPQWLSNTLIALMLAYAQPADQNGEERTMQRLTIWVPILVTMMAGAAAAQTAFYPAQGQTTAKQSQDLTACPS